MKCKCKKCGLEYDYNGVLYRNGKKMSPRCPECRKGPTDAEIIKKAREIYHNMAIYTDDDIEIDDRPAPKISRGSDGYWVSAWVFIEKFKTKKK